MAIDIVRTASCNAPLEVAFAYVADYRRIPEWMIGVEQFEVVGDKDHGVGAVFEVTLDLGLRIRTRIQAVEWEENRVIGMDTLSGLGARSRWYFERSGENLTTVTANVSYTLPFGPAGKVMGRIMQPFVRQAVTQGGKSLAENIERVAQSSGVPPSAVPHHVARIGDSGHEVPAGDHGQDRVRPAVPGEDQRGGGGGGHERHVEDDVVEREDATAEGVVDAGLHEGVDADLDPL
jgi:ribosome-associated toxin RatA of RatAB toxin-antitoxin module